MHCVRCSVSFQVDIFVPAKLGLGHYHLYGANVTDARHLVPKIMHQK